MSSELATAQSAQMSGLSTRAARMMGRVLYKITAPDTCVLMYHGIPRDTTENGGLDARSFESHVAFLKDSYRIISVEELADKGSRPERQRVVLTFDDGFRNNFEVVAPILHRHGIPALFFVSSRHCEPGKYLWFAYLRALARRYRGNGFSFRGVFYDMSSGRRGAHLLRLKQQLLSMTPHPVAMYEAIENELPLLSDFVPAQEEIDYFAGMTEDHIAQLAADPLFQIGVHTVDHPLLTRCEKTEAERQLKENQALLERVSGRSCEWVAWPSGDYDRYVTDVCHRNHLHGGFAVVPRCSVAPQWELPRIDIYTSRLDELSLKTALADVLSAPALLSVRVLLNRIRNHECV